MEAEGPPTASEYFKNLHQVSQIRKVLEVPEYQSYWQQVVQTRKTVSGFSLPRNRNFGNFQD